MKKYLYTIIFVIVLAIVYFVFFRSSSVPENPESLFSLPDGFSINKIASNVEGVGIIEFDEKGRMLASQSGKGQITILEKDSSGIWQTSVLIDGLKKPHGMAFYTNKLGQTYLYVAESNQLIRYPYNNETGKISKFEVKNIANFPADGLNDVRSLVLGENLRQSPVIAAGLPKESFGVDKFFFGVGSSCDACIEESWKRGTVLESDPEGNYTAEIAGGLRNPSFITIHPIWGYLWISESGRNGLGPDLPPDEINVIKSVTNNTPFGAHRFGWPYCYGNQVEDSEFKPNASQRIDVPSDCSQTIGATIELPAHSSPKGLSFIDNSFWPKDWQYDLLVALHGSDKSKSGTSYKVVRYDLDKDGNILGGPYDFISNWRSGNGKNIYGTPTDLKFDSNGSLFVTDDKFGNIYEVRPI